MSIRHPRLPSAATSPASKASSPSTAATITWPLARRSDAAPGRRPGRLRRPHRRVARQRPSTASRSAPPPLSVAELILQFWERHATLHYRHPDGTPTSELADYRLSLRPLRELFGLTPAAEFSPLKLKAVRQAHGRRRVVAGAWSTSGSGGSSGCSSGRWPRSSCRSPSTAPCSPSTGSRPGGPRPGRRRPVRPVPDEHVEATLPFLSGPLRAMVQVQRLTGMRPGEAARMRGRDLDTCEAVVDVPPGPAQDGLAGEGAELC